MTVVMETIKSILFDMASDAVTDALRIVDGNPNTLAEVLIKERNIIQT